MILQVWDMLPKEILAEEGTTQCKTGSRIDLESRLKCYSSSEMQGFLGITLLGEE